MAVVVSCDIKYYDRFAGPFVRSIRRNTKQNAVYVCVTTEDMQPWEYASARFFFAQKILEPELVILDVDSLCIGDFDLPAGDVGLYLRSEARDEMKVAAGMVVIRHRPWLDMLCMNLARESGWFADQKALWKTYQSRSVDYFDVSPFITWDFDEKPIWTAKGARKRYEPWKSMFAKYDHPDLRA